MSFGFGVGDLIATTELLSTTLRVLNEHPEVSTTEDRVMIAKLSIGLELAEKLTQSVQYADPQVFKSIVLPIVARLSEAAANFARTTRQVFGSGSSKWQKALWASRRSRLQREAGHVNDCVNDARLLLDSILIAQHKEATRMHLVQPLTSAPPKSSIVSTPTSPHGSVRTDSMPWTVIVDMLDESEWANSQSKLPAGDSNIDIVLVPDVGGHPYETWRGSSSTWIPDLVSDKALSPNIVHFGYDPTSILASDFTQGLKAEGKRLLDHLTYKVRSHSTVILCHGIGGCLVKAAITYGAQAAKYDSDYATTLGRLQCIINLGKPDWAVPGSVNRHLNLLRRAAQNRALRRITSLSVWTAKHPLSLAEYAAGVDLEFLIASERYSINTIDCCENKYVIADDGLLMVSQPSLSTPMTGPLLLEGNYFTMCQYQTQQSVHFDRLRTFVSKCVISTTPAYRCDEKSQQRGMILSSPVSSLPSKSAEVKVPPLVENSASDFERSSNQPRVGSPTLLDFTDSSDADNTGYVYYPDILHFQFTLARRTFVFKQSLIPLVFPVTRRSLGNVDTCDWIRGTEAYRQWHSHPTDEETSCIALLCVIGEPMTGKSTLLKFMTETFGEYGSIQTEQITRLVHICDENVPYSNMPTTILKSLIWQLLEEHPHLYLKIYHQYPKVPSLFGELGLLFVRLLLEIPWSVLIVIDNLEFSISNDSYKDISGSSELVSLLEELASMRNVKILTTCNFSMAKLSYEINLSDFVEKQRNGLSDFSRAEMDRYTVTSTRSRNIHESVRESLCAASHGSFLRLQIGIHFLSNVRKENDFHIEVRRLAESDTATLLNDIGRQYIKQLMVLSGCIEPISFEEVAIISGCLDAREGTDQSFHSKTFEELSTLRSLNAASEFAPLEGIFFHIKDGFLYPSTRRVAQVVSVISYDNDIVKSLSRSLDGLCSVVLEHYSTSVSTETIEHAVNLYQHNSITARRAYRASYPLLTYAVSRWMRFVSGCDGIPPISSQQMYEPENLAWIMAAVVDNTHDRSPDTNQSQFQKLWIVQRDQMPGYVPLCESVSEVAAALRDAGLRKDNLAVRSLLDYHYRTLVNRDFDELFSVWIRDAVKSDESKTVCFPLEILDLSIAKEPSQLDICFSHEQELHHLFRLAIKNKYWGVAGGIWTALTESDTLDFPEWIKEHGNDMLYEAVQSGNCSIVTALINQGAGRDYASSDEISLLQTAAATGAEDIIEVLTATGTGFSDEFNQFNSSYVDVEQIDNDEMDSKLSDNPSNQGHRQTGLMVASASGFVDIVRLLLNASMDAEDPYYVNNLDSEGRSALHLAVLFGHEGVVNELLVAAANIEQRDLLGRTPMHMAAAGDADGLIELLCKQGASASTKDKKDLTPLHVAACNGSTRAISRLVLRSPPSIHFRDKKGFTPLHHAADYGSEATVRLLLENRAPCDARTKDGNTPLHLAAKSKHPSDGLLQLLLEKSKSPHTKNKQGLTPGDLAEKHGNRLLLERLHAVGQRASEVQEADLLKHHPSQTPFLAFSLQVNELSESVVAQNLRAGHPDHYLNRAIEDLRKATDSVRDEHGRLGPEATWNSTSAGSGGKAVQDSSSIRPASNL